MLTGWRPGEVRAKWDAWSFLLVEQTSYGRPKKVPVVDGLVAMLGG